MYRFDREGIKLYKGDCVEFLKTLESDSIDYINVDPPYNIGYDGGDKWDKPMTEDDYLYWSMEYITELARVLKPGRMLSVWGTQKIDLFYRLKLEVLNKIPGLVGQTPIIWSYNWGGRGRKNFSSKFETAWCYSKGKEFLFNPEDVEVERKMKKNIRTGKDYTNGTLPTCIWEGNLATVSHEARESKFHPTVKPQFVLQRMIKGYSNPGDLVLDCFSGSGSMAVAAVETGRRFIGSEREEEYVVKSIERIEKHMTDNFELK